MYYSNLFISYEINYEFYKENTKFSELASIVFSDSFGVKNYRCGTC